MKFLGYAFNKIKQSSLPSFLFLLAIMWNVMKLHWLQEEQVWGGGIGSLMKVQVAACRGRAKVSSKSEASTAACTSEVHTHGELHWILQFLSLCAGLQPESYIHPTLPDHGFSFGGVAEWSRKGKGIAGKFTRKRVHDALDALTVEKSKIETEIKNKMQQKSKKNPELLDNEKSAAVVALIITRYTVKISNYGWDHFVKIYINSSSWISCQECAGVFHR